MHESCNDIQMLISGYLDGELEPEEERRIEAHIQSCSACQQEYQLMKRLVVGTTAACAIEEPPEEVWDTFLDSVYNRLERKTGWLLVIVGSIGLVLLGLVLYITLPWASPLTKVLVMLPGIGLFMLFLSVLRQRLRIAKTDRYSREVIR